ncbi:MAG TPA: SDR family NAD(P)-dependent oxidoreductase [Acidimicrobiia bacterium]|nr:SDR family NAD(P)-dependent oxidoreductase [Acidimicrobiia bacterium]
MNRRVLVTGANSGIGLATVLEVARLGFHAIGSARNQGGAEDILRAAEKKGVEVDTVVFDLADRESYPDVVSGLDLWGLVNNAAFVNAGAIEDVPLDDARRQLEVMTVAPVALALAAVPGMRRRAEGRIVTIGSVAVGSGVPMLGWYQACKHALTGATDALRNELASSGIDVVIVEPSTVDTPIWAKARKDLESRYRGSWHRASYTRALKIIDNLQPWMRSPEAVASVVGGALTAGKPDPVYSVGIDAIAVNTGMRVLPRRITDLIAQRALRA